ncbi:DEAD/DEAH box helicase [Candidatus Woesearchaeota archaeon]|nr:DEAD/DEAH box helicase [Candidatus Woesearchaeota archaeon]
MSFEQLNLNAEVIKALAEEGISEPTKIQEIAIPLVLAGKDVIGMSFTGSGKTVAFGAPIIQNIKPRAGLQTLILTPTRELAVQISSELKKFSKYKRCHIATVYGGVGLGPQIGDMARADIIVGTPGRMLDHLQRGNLDLSHINCFVLDEADKMVEMGFIEDVEKILSQTPERRQMLLFGATISCEIDHLKADYMHNPEVAEADKYVKQELLEQYYYNIPHNQKFSLLVHLLKKETAVPLNPEHRANLDVMDRVLIFCSSRSTVELLTANLRNQGVKAEMIHGKMTQSKRLQVIDRFNHDKIKVLVASPVAARGLDIKNITHIFNYDLSPDPQEYIHRIGRTARAGESGKAITLLSDKDYQVFGQIFDRYRLDIKELPLEDFPRLRFEVRSREPSRFGGQRFGERGFRSQRDFRGPRDFSGGNRYNSRSSGGSFGSRAPPRYRDIRTQPRSRELTRRTD